MSIERLIEIYRREKHIIERVNPLEIFWFYYYHLKKEYRDVDNFKGLNRFFERFIRKNGY